MTDREPAIRVRAPTTCTGSTSTCPRASWVVFTGVSGSGKSSLAFDTVAAESQRMLNETYSGFVQLGLTVRFDPIERKR